MSALAAVLDAIARVVLGDADEAPVTIGTVTLRAHQRDALRRIRASIERVGGGLLADEPGLGKTFVALALAREFPHAVVVAPAALRGMWRDAAAAAGVAVPFFSFESLSRRAAPDVDTRPGLVIVDEAHHVCNPATARYSRLATFVAYRRVLLLSATPVRNRRTELSALLALFMGPLAYSLDDAGRSRCIVRRGGDVSLRPAIDGPHWHRVRAVPRLREMIAKLPSPLPALDGIAATALLRMSLARCWASSLAALDAALRRRLQRGAALGAILDDGRLPTRAELRAWVVGDDAVQLAFPMFATHETANAARLRAVLDEHLGAVRELRDRVRARVGSDAKARAHLLLGLRRAHVNARIVAFTSYAATAEALYRALHLEPGVALLTARGARTAGGSRPRADVIDALAAPLAPDTTAAAVSHVDASGRDTSRHARARDEISLVITTDLLSEGVNLQGASVIVHLDVPWTPAGLDQRVGRAARMGSPHACVHVHGFAPPAAAERLLTLDRRLTRKRGEQCEAARASIATEQLRALVRPWRSSEALGPVVTSVVAAQAGFIAVVDEQAGPALACGALRGDRRWRISDSPDALCTMVRAVRTYDTEQCAQFQPDARFESSARVALERWLSGRHARGSSGATSRPSHARRAVLARLDHAMSRASPHARAALANRIARVRALVGQVISAGAERILDDLARDAAPDLDSLLAACETRLADRLGRVAPGADAAAVGRRENQVVRALLLLRRPA